MKIRADIDSVLTRDPELLDEVKPTNPPPAIFRLNAENDPHGFGLLRQWIAELKRRLAPSEGIDELRLEPGVVNKGPDKTVKQDQIRNTNTSVTTTLFDRDKYMNIRSKLQERGEFDLAAQVALAYVPRQKIPQRDPKLFKDKDKQLLYRALQSNLPIYVETDYGTRQLNSVQSLDKGILLGSRL